MDTVVTRHIFRSIVSFCYLPKLPTAPPRSRAFRHPTWYEDRYLKGYEVLVEVLPVYQPGLGMVPARGIRRTGLACSQRYRECRGY